VVEAYILIQVHVGASRTAAERIGRVDGVRSVEVVTGPYDVIVRAEAASISELAKLVLRPIQDVEGVTRTLTCPVLRHG
jgi:DNA-binding Lrp family transcriptional regulator